MGHFRFCRLHVMSCIILWLSIYICLSSYLSLSIGYRYLYISLQLKFIYLSILLSICIKLSFLHGIFFRKMCILQSNIYLSVLSLSICIGSLCMKIQIYNCLFIPQSPSVYLSICLPQNNIYTSLSLSLSRLYL